MTRLFIGPNFSGALRSTENSFRELFGYVFVAFEKQMPVGLYLSKALFGGLIFGRSYSILGS